MTLPDGPGDVEVRALVLLQADLDDESPEVLGHVCERLFEQGALDVVRLAVAMKKGRVGTRLEVLTTPQERDALAQTILLETTTLGVRFLAVERYALPRRLDTVTVEGHPIRIKTAFWAGKPLRRKPEFEDCRRAADALGVPISAVREWAAAAAQDLDPGPPEERSDEDFS